MPDLVFKNACFFNMNQENACLSKSIVRAKFEIYLQLKIKTLEQRHWHR